MEQSILNTTKKILGIEADYTAYDLDIITHINTALADITDLGIGPTNGFQIEDATAVWSDFIGDNMRYNPVKSFVWLKVRTLFDPPEGRYAIQATDGQLAQMLWRLSVNRENVEWVDPDPDIPEDTILSGGD